MAGKAKKGEKQGTSIARILGTVFTIVLLVGYIIYHTNFVTGRSLLLAFPGWEVTYRGCWPNPFGGAWVSDVTLMPDAEFPDEVFHFDSLKVDVPIWQFYSSGLSRKFKDRLNAIEDIRLEFSGGHGNMTESFTGEMGVFGNVSAAPFEAEGCAEDGIWISEEMAGMGLEAGPTELIMAWHVEDESLVKEQSIHTPGVGRVDFREKQLRYDDFPLFSLVETGYNELASREWHVKDEGFSAARISHCAKKDGVSPAQFVERHLATAERIFAALGLQPNESTRSAYRNYLEHGAPLDLALEFSPEIGGELYADENLGNWLDSTRGGFQVDGRSVGLGMSAIEPRPLPEDDDVESTYALLASERAASEPAALEPPAAEVIAADVPDMAVPTIAVATAPPALAPSIAPAESESEPEAVEDTDTITDYAKLRAEVGQRFILHLKQRSPMRVEVIASENGVLKVRRHLGSGLMEQDITRANFERAIRVH